MNEHFTVARHKYLRLEVVKRCGCKKNKKFGEVQVSLFVAGAIFGEVRVAFSWQAQYLVKLKCHFSWQALYSVKFGMIAGARNVVIFNRICFGRARKVTSAARRVQVCVFMVGSFSERSRIGRAWEMTLQPFSANLSQILEGHFSWQAQYLVRLEGDICCSTHCK